ncbi:MAG: glycosyltransferase [Acidobacteria bacterium]|nr:glycosyltransferase [Acidobacteriota bacterium]
MHKYMQGRFGAHSKSSPGQIAVVVSPALKYGSWGWFEDIIANSPEIRWVVVAYGVPPRQRLPEVEWITWPMGDYLKIGRFAARRYMLWLNFAYVLPLTVIAFFVVWRRKPGVVVGNGIATTALLRPCRLISGASIWLGYHGYVSWLGKSSRWLTSRILSATKGAICNSQTSAKDLHEVLLNRAVIPVEHWADHVFFSSPIEQSDVREGKLRILYVGRTDYEKFGQCQRVMMKMVEEGLAELTIIGPPRDPNSKDSFRYIPYVSDRRELAQYYQWAELVWSPADVDYLSRPGVEALACGRPVIVSDVPAVGGKNDGTIRIPKTLVPRGIGWVVDGTNDAEAETLIRNLSLQDKPVADQNLCREFALERFSAKNIGKITQAWFDV